MKVRTLMGKGYYVVVVREEDRARLLDIAIDGQPSEEMERELETALRDVCSAEVFYSHHSKRLFPLLERMGFEKEDDDWSCRGIRITSPDEALRLYESNPENKEARQVPMPLPDNVSEIKCLVKEDGSAFLVCKVFGKWKICFTQGSWIVCRDEDAGRELLQCLFKRAKEDGANVVDLRELPFENTLGMYRGKRFELDLKEGEFRPHERVREFEAADEPVVTSMLKSYYVDRDNVKEDVEYYRKECRMLLFEDKGLLVYRIEEETEEGVKEEANRGRQGRKDDTGAKKVGNIVEIYVEPFGRRRSIAAKLLESALYRMKEEGCQNATLGTGEENYPAIRLYEKFGFREAGITSYRKYLIDQRFVRRSQ